ncbi:hypothetical protein Lfu02_15430 [Longispora fulva]|uniref:Sulfatase maturation enzyme AslB (Radical SAM superfamily) n=1 Tax=Longispora fulva TaxID=619741 RepID=A0A8J7KZ84_9ACTN|nr:radical SAM protein [Longispora fulva]MBG6140447.1 sulfatase maturation enzyme AslB (radical SAM superfamily) [Longispora fulva]GIG57171.1 hypothetical protein Lfu02_15430 [Longispora fulva]
MTRRVFGAAGGLVHDPATAQTHFAPGTVPDGRVDLEDAEVAGWPLATPDLVVRLMPMSVCWSPIVRCNLHCPHCLDDTTVPELDKHGRAAVADVLARSEVLGVDISGGEPLLLRDLPGLTRTIREGGHAAVSVTTNGWYLTRWVNRLAETVDAVRVSFDGPTSEHHDRLRGAGSFARACSGVRAAVDAGLRVQMQMVLMNTTGRHAQAMIDLAHELGAGGLTFLQLLPIGSAVDLAEQEMVSDHGAQALLNGLALPDGLSVRLRTRRNAAGFSVVRADGQVWRNGRGALSIGSLKQLTVPGDLMLAGRDGAA